ncbi:MAG: endonuclease/exonuclease/phosphatase family protein [Egibacteraceae bacterium]
MLRSREPSAEERDGSPDSSSRLAPRAVLVQTVVALTFVAAVPAAGGLLSGLVSGGRWPFVVGTYPRLAELFTLSVAAVALAALGRRRSAAAAGLLALLAASTVVLALTRALPDPQAAAGPDRLRVAVFNTGWRNDDVPAIAGALRAAEPDVAILPESRDVVAGLSAALPGWVRLGAREAGAAWPPPVVFARQRLPARAIELNGTRQALQVTVPLGALTVELFAAHPLPPVTRRWAKAHDAAFAALTAAVAAQRGPVVLAGDLNATPWTPTLQRIMEAAGLTGATVQGTFELPVLGPSLDHVLHSEELVTVSRALGPFAGSDHRLLVVELAPATEPKTP